MTSPKLAILFVAEQGTLEQQALLLIQSIQKFLPPHSCETFIFCPRKDYCPSAKVLKVLENQTTAVFTKNLNTKYVNFPLANTLYAARFFEQNFPEYRRVLLVDTDTVFLNPIPDSAMQPGIHVRAVDNKGVGSTGIDDPNDSFWQEAFNFFDLELPEPSLITSIRRERIRPYYNSGFTLCNHVDGFFSSWFEDFDRLMESNIRPDFIGRDGTNFGFFEQFTLALTTRRFKELLKPLAENMNYPIPFHPFLRRQNRHIPLQELTHIHYHKWFQHPRFTEHVFDESEKNTAQFKWLQDKLPLNPTIDGPFKT